MKTLLALLLITATATAAGTVELVADGLKEPFGLGFYKKDILVTEYGGHRLIAVSGDGRKTVLAGSGKAGTADGEGKAASLNGPHNLAVLPDGIIALADTLGNRLRMFDPKSKAVTTLGGGEKGFAGDGGPVSGAKFDQLYHVAMSPKGDVLFLCDLGNRRIRQVDMKTKIITTVAGNGQKGIPKDGEQAKDQPLVDPRAVEMDAKGRLWILERGGHALRVVEGGKIRTVAGTGQPGFSAGGDGPALKATFNGPKNLFVTKTGTVLIADTENHCIREYDPEKGTIRRVMGTGKKGMGNLGSPLETTLNRPHAVSVDAAGTMYVSDSDNSRVLKVEE